MKRAVIDQTPSKTCVALRGATGILAFLLLWQVAVSLSDLKILMPGPLNVLAGFFQGCVYPVGKMIIPLHVVFSLIRVLVGFLLAAVIGTIAGIAMGSSRLVKAIFWPIFETIRPIPGIAWIPLAILWMGIDESSKYFIIFMSAFSIVTINAYDGATRADQTLQGAARMLGANNRQVFLNVTIPSAIPQIFAGLQAALSVSWMTVIAAEMVRSEYGVGWMITTGSDSGNMVQVISGMLAIGVVGLILATLLRDIERRLCAWNQRGN